MAVCETSSCLAPRVKVAVSYRATRAFSLIELLAAITIVAALAALTFPVLAGLQMRSKSTVCLSNLRQVGMALLLYTGENNGNLPRTRHSHSEEKAWIFLLSSYLEDVHEVRISPADPKGKDRLRRNGTSYIVNDAIFDIPTDPFGVPLPGGIGNIQRIQRPGRTMLAFVVSDNRGTGSSNDHTHTNQWTSWPRFLADVEADRHRTGGRSPGRDRGHSHYLYADGGARTFEASAIKPYFDQGINIGEVNRAP